MNTNKFAENNGLNELVKRAKANMGPSLAQWAAQNVCQVCGQELVGKNPKAAACGVCNDCWAGLDDGLGG